MSTGATSGRIGRGAACATLAGGQADPDPISQLQ
jgi:hypothetical protein